DRGSRRVERWLAPGPRRSGEWVWNGRSVRVVGDVLSEDDMIRRLRRKTRALEKRLVALEGRGALPQDDKYRNGAARDWSEETRDKVIEAEKIGDERAKARSAARAELERVGKELRLEFQHNQAIVVQSSFRRHLGIKKMREARAKHNAKIQNEGAKVIQAKFRGHLARRNVKAKMENLRRDLESKAATAISSRWRGTAARRNITDKRLSRGEREVAVAVFVQSWWRARLAARQTEVLRQAYLQQVEEIAAIMVVTAFRCLKAKKEKARLLALREYEMEVAAAIMLQAAWRGHQGRKKAKVVRRKLEETESKLRSMEYADNVRKASVAKLFDKKRAAAILIQTYARGFLERKRVAKLQAKHRQEEAEEAEIERLLQEAREKRVSSPASPTPASPITNLGPPGSPGGHVVFEDFIEAPFKGLRGETSSVQVHVVVQEVLEPYQLRVEAQETLHGHRFHRKVDIDALEELLTPMFALDENVPKNSIPEPTDRNTKAMMNWVRQGKIPRRKHLIGWMLKRMWIDTVADGEFELCLGTLGKGQALNNTMSAVLAPSSPLARPLPAKPKITQSERKPKQARGRTRDNFVVKYAD
ncbi:Abnormal spindle-like microcephaly-associated protein homolog, partial [Durusdinium trenchii]